MYYLSIYLQVLSLDMCVESYEKTDKDHLRTQCNLQMPFTTAVYFSKELVVFGIRHVIRHTRSVNYNIF